MFDGIPLSSWFFLAGSLVGLWFTVQAVRPTELPRVTAIASFFAGWLANELAAHHLFWQAISVVGFVAAGALDGWPGLVAIGIVLAQWGLAVGLIRTALATPHVVEDALVATLGVDYRSELPEHATGWDTPRRKVFFLPFAFRDKNVRRERNVVFGRAGGRELTLDVFSPREAPSGPRPVIIYVHGGGWIIGHRDRQGLPLLTEMATRGWIGVQPSYRLSPLATFPDHLIDVKRAIAWVREHADELGADPDMIAVAGGSAGGHLAGLAGLTMGRADLQPGFEDADTSIQACVPVYPAVDPTNVAGDSLAEMADFFGRVVVKADAEDDPQAWRDASWFGHLDEVDVPPWLTVIGLRDTLTPAAPAAAATARIAEASTRPVGFIGLPGAQHAFEVFWSIRSAHAVLGMARFLETINQRRQAEDLPTVG